MHSPVNYICFIHQSLGILSDVFLGEGLFYAETRNVVLNLCLTKKNMLSPETLLRFLITFSYPVSFLYTGLLRAAGGEFSFFICLGNNLTVNKKPSACRKENHPFLINGGNPISVIAGHT